MISGMSKAKQSKTKKKKKNPSRTRVYETRVPLEKIEQNRATSRTKQSIDALLISRIKYSSSSVELESIKLEFH